MKNQQYAVKGKSYESVLSPQERILSFIADIENKLKRGTITSAETVLNCAKIWFKDELKAVEK